MSTRSVHRRTVSLLESEIMACESCADRLSGIDNDSVSRVARDDEVRRLRQRTEELRYALECVIAAESAALSLFSGRTA